MVDEEQDQAFNLIVSGHNLFLTGQAGTGKSYVIKKAVKHLRNIGKMVALTCSTGIATSVFEHEHACTLHKWAGLEDGRHQNDELLHLIINDERFVKLPPIKNELYGDFGHHCFLHPCFKDAFSHHINLEIIHRQSETLLVTAVNEFERETISENTIAFLNSLHRPLNDKNLEKAVHLFARNVDVDLFNYERIQKIPSQLYVYQADDEGRIKIGIPVILLVNLSDELVNGKVGTVTYIDNDSCTLSVQFCIKSVKKTVKLTKYLFTKYDPVDKIILAKRLQFSIKVAYAITIHKSQGMSLQYLSIDCSNACFPGQIGVAVGRAKSTDGLMLKNFKLSLVKPILMLYTGFMKTVLSM
ncbi:PIF1 [Mytilus coruscus]|uniref:ATP-dependent DNA helicase n=1 Tax=Mytilus coruscus TaxID=42192 RepID=A0A6J8AMC4_MYTCO|nr:PIF1 [Mytilus coruscus]